MTGNVNFVAASAGVFGIVGLLLLLLVRRSRRGNKRKNSNADACHVEDENNRPFLDENQHVDASDTRSNILTPALIIYRYLYKNYWKKQRRGIESTSPDTTSFRDYKQVHRITPTSPPVLVIYSKKSVWELGLSDRAEQGYKEQFSFLMRGPESSSDRERLRKIEYVLDDLVEFRKVI